MLNTYKLDKYGLPYKVGNLRTEKTLKKEETGKPVSGLLSHNGKQKAFHLYVFGQQEQRLREHFADS